jgi:prepilin-type N-terminal cleavage/methylation domain-containing protein
MDSQGGKHMARRSRGFTLLETMIALSLVSVSMTTLVLAMGSGSKFGALGRRQATAMTVARSQAETLSHVSYADPRIANSNIGNDVDAFADPAVMFARATKPAGADAADYEAPQQVRVGDEKYDVFVNVRPTADQGACATGSPPVFTPAEQGKQIAVIVRYKVGDQFMRAVALGYRYNPCVVGVPDGLPL